MATDPEEVLIIEAVKKLQHHGLVNEPRGYRQVPLPAIPYHTKAGFSFHCIRMIYLSPHYAYIQVL